jgi:hypothetical protein
METPGVKAILNRLPEKPSALDIDDATVPIRSLIISDMLEAENLARYPGQRVLREVNVLEEQPHLSEAQLHQMPPNERHGFTLRVDSNGRNRVYKGTTDIDSLVVEINENGGKAKTLRVEQQKTGKNDTPTSARAQHQVTLDAVERARASGHALLLELPGKIDITSQVDIETLGQAPKVTVGPLPKKFDHSLGINGSDLERLIKQLVTEAIQGDLP